VKTFTDSEGWAETFGYDAMGPDDVDRLSRWHDGHLHYDKLDLSSYRDRLGRVWSYTHDADRRLTKIVDPLGKQTLFGYNGIDELTSLTDPNSKRHELGVRCRGRLTQKTYADASTVTYTYENTTSRLKSTLDAANRPGNPPGSTTRTGRRLRR